MLNKFEKTFKTKFVKNLQDSLNIGSYLNQSEFIYSEQSFSIFN